MRYLTADSKAGHVKWGEVDVALLNAPSRVRPDIRKPIWHAVLSLPEKERLDACQWKAICRDFLSGMGLQHHESTFVVHNETSHQHVHIVVNRVDFAGTVWSGEFDGKRAIAVAKELERKYGLKEEVFKPQSGARANLSRNEIEMAIRTETLPPRLTLQQLIDEAVVGRPRIDIFLSRMSAAGVDIQPNISLTTGRIAGLAFAYNGIAFKGSQLGKAYSWEISKRE
ncbi:relaxase/mobilization nuclease domain-containing protein [uncultured Herbaspirillum sp.]|uniref:relaxase/mobilization nuclease domain-containing protein n=1 Tax=uncultured Herbaspirillum sp. TaxID=160236 RepID=UPI002625306C|nr:relaxase/mobilization nuclease domain-containing protein [uncultured Herbaspirillum sp.]